MSSRPALLGLLDMFGTIDWKKIREGLEIHLVSVQIPVVSS